MPVSRMWLVVIILGALFLVGIALIAHRPVLSHKTTAPDKKEFMQKSREASRALVERAVKALNEKKLDDALRSLMQAVAVYPPNTEAYGLIARIFLSTGQEMLLYETLERAGRSYPSFDDILAVVDNDSLRRIPLPVEAENAYLAPFRDNKKMAMSLMFDDGEASVYTGILPLFDKYGYKATIGVIAGQVSSAPGDPTRGTWSAWKDAAGRGFEIANHSMNHIDALTLKPSDFEHEIDDAGALIAKNTGQTPRSYVFPLDLYSDAVLDHVLHAHLAPRKPEFLRSVYPRTVDIMYGGPNFSLSSANRLVDIGIDRRLWLIAECHGLDVNSRASYKPLKADFLDQALGYLKSRGADVWVAPFGDVFEYLAWRKGARVERKDISPVEAEIMVHHGTDAKALPSAVTVVLKVSAGAGIVAAQRPDGTSLKAWPCDTERLCVNVSACDEPVRVTWGGVGT